MVIIAACIGDIDGLHTGEYIPLEDDQDNKGSMHSTFLSVYLFIHLKYFYDIFM